MVTRFHRAVEDTVGDKARSILGQDLTEQWETKWETKPDPSCDKISHSSGRHSGRQSGRQSQAHVVTRSPKAVGDTVANKVGDKARSMS